MREIINMKKKIMMLGIRKLTMVVVREKPKQTDKVDKKVFIRACTEYRKAVTL